MSRPTPPSSRFDHANNTWRGAEPIKFFTKQCSPASCHTSFLLGSKIFLTAKMPTCDNATSHLRTATESVRGIPYQRTCAQNIHAVFTGLELTIIWTSAGFLHCLFSQTEQKFLHNLDIPMRLLHSAPNDVVQHSNNCNNQRCTLLNSLTAGG